MSLHQPQHGDPIVAIATAPGKGGVGVVRFSFPSSSSFQAFCAAFCGKLPKPRMATLLTLRDVDQHAIDEGIALLFNAPASFTGEHVLEFQGHGGQAVLQGVVAHALAVARQLNIPLRHAMAGEFTQRAFLNDKLDLAQAEAVADLIDAGSMATAKAAAASLSGVFSRQVNELADRIVHLRLLLEATLDFPEEEIEFLEKADAKGQLAGILNAHGQLLNAAQEGVKFRDGLQIVLVGEPNVGKSSLLNALAGEEIAIVSAIAGTTRDRIKQELNIRGIPLVLVDTAGLRETVDEVERIGIERTRKSVQEADLLLILKDATQGPHDALHQHLELPVHLPTLTVLNKVDLLPEAPQLLQDVLPVSAKNGQGLEQLKDAILAKVGIAHTPDHGFMARQRHVDALLVCGQHLVAAHEFAQQDDRILDLFAEELRLAHDALGEITGRMLPDDLLGLIFSRFCIGK
ncbi:MULTISPECIES: tRNA uridine-5-carboxymethylaminomethyl(34) synthesis GTPase MnmE [unclassified Limnobacter]|uniref:tRNA uridine-5-carboxymethylaminomethyl(34) synthesis GTPase MnmE n=1 Tax=unclassified Limnobacter TaxID=2630203 RepID=UPI000156C3B8|nr:MULTISPECIES: tRNA uridine-5-carboxymethylaminomethyl(34) synthesis GTPase MnmE [unclassified Limnobacter]EDM84707.1 tRNA modification GTPase TrmE [Limnobacter sp. MED105]MAZ09364.1 tRNA uridine-5-carboxymethylaminomethyl(34) synthesis GTPase MnmE [Sutterellaceae bacterium]